MDKKRYFSEMFECVKNERNADRIRDKDCF